MDGLYHLHAGDALDAYAAWPAPALILSDGAYGVRGFHGDTTGPSDLPGWYAPHIRAWARAAAAATTLWFWNTEVGWATVHPLLQDHGFEYVQLIVWDKGIAHIAGNVNGKSIRRFPTTTEVCAFYQRRQTLPSAAGPLPLQHWLRAEWQRSGLPLHRANAACGVNNAATRKYLTTDWLWYAPPGEMLARLAAYANQHGRPDGRPYFSTDGRRSLSATEWDALRYRWTHEHGLTNVWSQPPVSGAERLKGTLRRAAPRVHSPTVASAAHLNQKPLAFMERILAAATAPGDVIWEPFGGLCTASLAALRLGRVAYAAEVDPHFAELARARLDAAARPGAD